MNFKGLLLLLSFIGFLLWTSYRSGYEAALTDVRYGNVRVVCEICTVPQQQ